jgi:N-terminal domain of galactosyltransferase
MATLRHRLGALAYDWPRFRRAMSGRGKWVAFRNRGERLSIDAATGGARCEWVFSSDLHIANVFPSTGRALMRRALGEWPIESAETPRVSGTPRVSFIIGHRGEARLPLLLETLGSIAAQRDVAIECIVVEQSVAPTATLPPWVRRVHTLIESDALPYNRSWAFNAGAKVAQSKLLVLHDNDILVPAAYASELVKRHGEGNEFIDLKRFLFYLDGQKQLERVSQNLLGGSIAADRDAYFAIGGFDESFVGWGGEDNELWERAATRRTFTFGYLPFVHLWHAPQPEKPAAQTAGGAQRFAELSRVAVEERIRVLAERQNRS